MVLFAFALALISQPSGTACETISRPTSHWGSFASSFTVGELSVRVTEGVTDCTFNLTGVGSCSLIKPKTLVVNRSGQETWFAVPDDKGANLQIDRHRVTCTIRPLVRMD